VEDCNPPPKLLRKLDAAREVELVVEDVKTFVEKLKTILPEQI